MFSYNKIKQNRTLITPLLKHKIKALHSKASPYTPILKAKPVGRYSLHSDGQDMLVVPKTMWKTFGDRAFAKTGPSLWNELPDDIHRAFKSQLMTFPF